MGSMTADGGCEDSRFCSPHSWSCPGSPSAGATSGTCNTACTACYPTRHSSSPQWTHESHDGWTTNEMSVCCDNLQSAVTADALMEGHYCSVNNTHTSVFALTGLPCAAAHPSMNKNKRLNVSEELPQSKPAVSASLVSMSYLLVLSVLIGLQANMKLMLYVFSFWRAN